MDAQPGWLSAALRPLILGRQRTFCCHSATLSGRHAPNSLDAVRECVSAGVPRLEVDVRFTADDELLCFHDSNLDRTTTSTGRVAEMVRIALEGVTYRPTGTPLAWLEDVVRELNGSETLLQVDLKLNRPISSARVERLERALEPLGGRVILGSQSPWNLRKFTRVPVAFDPTLFLNYTPGRRQAPYPRQRGLHGFWDDSPLARNPYASAREYLEARVDELVGMVPAAIEWMVDIDTVLRMAELGFALGLELDRRGIALAAWTLRERHALQPTLARLWEAGVTTVITDIPLAAAASAVEPEPCPASVNPQ